MKIVINRCYGGFGLSQKAKDMLAELGFTGDTFDPERNDPLLVQVVETLISGASDMLAHLKVVEIPDGVEWEIEEYDGMEWVAEKHRTWL